MVNIVQQLGHFPQGQSHRKVKNTVYTLCPLRKQSEYLGDLFTEE